jgi:hypothetical protein
VLVDPWLAAVERPREFAVRVTARQIVPLGVPLAPRDVRAARPRWQVLAAGFCLLASGLGVSLLLFGRSSDAPAPRAPVTATAIDGAGSSMPAIPATVARTVVLPTPP